MSKTGFVSPDGMSKTTAMLPEEGSKTRVVLPSDMGETQASHSEDAEHPVVGWLVVIEGPGKGRSFELTFGMNSVGRTVDNKVSLNFGDQMISSEDHFGIAYDDRNKRFLITARSGRNLVYIDNEPILDAKPLAQGTELSVGETTLKFVPLVSDDWDWSAGS